MALHYEAEATLKAAVALRPGIVAARDHIEQ
jgi:hypothetical protein